MSGYAEGPTWMEDAVREFMVAKCGLVFGDDRRARPTKSRQLERLAMLQEELAELAAAMARELPDHVVADALGDILYVLIGAFLEYNIPVRSVFDEIHRSNMTKERGVGVGVNAKPVKGERYEPPKLKELLECIAKSRRER